jgi:hypothetical protein
VHNPAKNERSHEPTDPDGAALDENFSEEQTALMVEFDNVLRKRKPIAPGVSQNRLPVPLVEDLADALRPRANQVTSASTAAASPIVERAPQPSSTSGSVPPWEAMRPPPANPPQQGSVPPWEAMRPPAMRGPPPAEGPPESRFPLVLLAAVIAVLLAFAAAYVLGSLS